MTTAQARKKFIGRMVVFRPRSNFYAMSPYGQQDLVPGEAVLIESVVGGVAWFRTYTGHMHCLPFDDIKLPEEIEDATDCWCS